MGTIVLHLMNDEDNRSTFSTPPHRTAYAVPLTMIAQIRWISLLFIVCLALHANAQGQFKTADEEQYPRHPDSLQKEGVPAGEIISGSYAESKIYPGTQRDYWIYIPKQYDGQKPAALMVFQDGKNYINRGNGFAVPNVFDNLIHEGKMPPCIGVFVTPGVVPAMNDQAQPRFNRSFEYDSMDDRYAKFLVDEFLPFVVKKHELKLTDDPNLKAICGSSSGGICAFTVAWHRPDQFRRVFTTVGTYVGLRGGDEYPTLVRKTDPKPLRVFLQDGKNDNNIYGGDWWMANQTMLRALEFSGYEVNHAFGEGFHNGKHGAAIFPDAMRWLWQDFDTKPVSTHPRPRATNPSNCWVRIPTGS